jgi:hypothetical protein
MGTHALSESPRLTQEPAGARQSPVSAGLCYPVPQGSDNPVCTMRAPQSLLDATNSVATGDARSVANEVDRILQVSFGANSFDRELLHDTFTLVDDLFAGRHAGYLVCDMPYHDLRHSLETALVMARLEAGCRQDTPVDFGALNPEYGLLGVLLALLHDVGYLRKATEAAMCGPQLTFEHEKRSVEFAEAYLRTTSLAGHAACASLIYATRLATDLAGLFAGHEEAAVVLGRMLGSADLLSQVSDRFYVERCYYHLYPELVLGRGDRTTLADGREEILYRDAFDLVRKSRQFYDRVIAKRLNEDFNQVTRFLAVHFDGADPYAEAVRDNLDRLARITAEGGLSLLHDEPPTTTRNLEAIYHASHPHAFPGL